MGATRSSRDGNGCDGAMLVRALWLCDAAVHAPRLHGAADARCPAIGGGDPPAQERTSHCEGRTAEVAPPSSSRATLADP